jgi:ABC-2 type transport system permease protein
MVMWQKGIDLWILFLWNCKLSIQRSMAYRTDFIIGLIISLIFTSAGPIVLYLLFTQTSGFPGWNLDQILLFQGVLMLTMGINNTAFGEVRNNAINIMRIGDFDRYLTKPYSSAGLILTRGFSLNHIGTILAGLTIVCIMLIRLEIDLGILQIGLFLLFLLFGTLFHISLNLLFCGTVIVLVNMGQLNLVITNIFRFASYPTEIFPSVFRGIFIFALPIALLAYFPSQVLLNRLDLNMLYGVLGGCFLLFISIRFWKLCIKLYTSAGG